MLAPSGYCVFAYDLLFVVAVVFDVKD